MSTTKQILVIGSVNTILTQRAMSELAAGGFTVVTVEDLERSLRVDETALNDILVTFIEVISDPYEARSRDMRVPHDFVVRQRFINTLCRSHGYRQYAVSVDGPVAPVLEKIRAIMDSDAAAADVEAGDDEATQLVPQLQELLSISETALKNCQLSLEQSQEIVATQAAQITEQGQSIEALRAQIKELEDLINGPTAPETQQ